MVDEEDINEHVAEVETEVDTEEQEVPKKAVKTTVKRESSREEKRQPTLDELLEVKAEAIERRKENKGLKTTIAGLETQLGELKGLIESQKAEQEAIQKAGQDRIVRATLLSTLGKAGCFKPEMALQMLRNEVQFDKNGDVKNADELVETFKKENEFFFTGPATTQTEFTPPKPKANTNTNILQTMDKTKIREELRRKGLQI